jgi:hypothetical protein
MFSPCLVSKLTCYQLPNSSLVKCSFVNAVVRRPGSIPTGARGNIFILGVKDEDEERSSEAALDGGGAKRPILRVNSLK